MGIGVSLFLFAIGAILAFAIDVQNASGIDINTIGVILMLVGGVGIALSLAFWSTWGGINRGGSSDTVVVERDRPRTRVVEREV